MASSQIEIASTSPFGCVLRDRNHRDGCSRDVNKVKATHVAFQRNIKNFVMDHLNISLSSDSTTNENNNNSNSSSSNNCNNNNNNDNGDDNNNNNDNNAGSWVSKAAKNNLGRLRLTRNNQNNDNNTNNEESESFLASLISPRHSRLLDRWAARQARGMVTTLEDQAELLANDDNNNVNNNNNSSSSNDNNIECSSETTKLGASSLVQIWEKRLKKSGGSKPNTTLERATSPNAGAIASSTSNNENVFEEQRGLVEAGEGTFEGPSFLSPSRAGINEESFPDWESSDHSISPPRGRWYSSESDRVSVADIIKRLTAPSQTQSPTPSFADDYDHEGFGGSSLNGSPCRDFAHENLDQRAFPTHVTCSPRIRGRQAFHDLLMQLENDRHGELKNLAERGAVSRFSQRGRIQATLRLRLLQRGVEANNPSRQKLKSPEVKREVQPKGSAIMQLREIFSSAIEKKSTVQAEVAKAKSPRKEVVNNKTQVENPPTPTELCKHTSSQTAQCTANHSTESTQNSVSQKRKQCHPCSDVTFQETRFKAQHNESRETAEATTSMTDSSLDERAENVEASNQQCAMSKSNYVETETVDEEEERNQQFAETCYNSTAEEEPRNRQYAETYYNSTAEDEPRNRRYAETRYDSTAEEEASNQNYAESSYEEMVDDFETIEQNYDGNNYDWISEISRPRSYWEERRQAWYREVLDTASPKEDIKDLLQRKTVSTFLSSGFREKMDRLMQSHRGTQTQLLRNQDDEENNQGLIAILQQRVLAGRTPQEDVREREEEEEVKMANQEEEEEDVEMVNQEEDDDDDDDEEEEEEDDQEHEEESLISSSCHEVNDYSNQSSSWSFSFRENEAGDDFDRVASTSSRPYQSQSFYQDSRQNSSPANHHSIEMELIYDLRGHMENLYHEMSELRKSIKGCMDMQMQLQQFMIQGIPAVKKEEKKSHSHNKAHKKGNCCICYEMKADSVLYRCGHMCTCLKCANELQWKGGKCPKCGAKIVDVVRVYVDV